MIPSTYTKRLDDGHGIAQMACNHHNQIDQIDPKRFYQRNIGNDHNLVKITLKTKKPKQLRIKYDLKKLNGPEVASDFAAKIGGCEVSSTALHE